MNLPPWLAQHIEVTTGAPVGARNARVARCPDCRAQILRGLSDDQCAWTATVDPTPLSPAGEATAHLTGRHTYALCRYLGQQLRLYIRDRWQIKGRPAGIPITGPFPQDIVADHVCRQELPGITSAIRPAPARKEMDNDKPPY